MKNEPWRGNDGLRVQHLEKKLSNKKDRINKLQDMITALTQRAEAAEAEVERLRDMLLDAMTQGCSDVNGVYDTGAISTWRDIGEYLVELGMLTHSRPGNGRRQFYKLKETEDATETT